MHSAYKSVRFEQAARAWKRDSQSDAFAFPERLIQKMIQAVEEQKTKASAAERLTGWRERLLRQSFLARSRD